MTLTTRLTQDGDHEDDTLEGITLSVKHMHLAGEP